MRIVFMGTPDFAVGTLQSIVDAGHEVVLVVTQPDKQKGRGKEIQYTPVKDCAILNGLSVYQPVKIKTEEAVAVLKEQNADLFVVAAFGQILSQEILDIPPYGCINVHASLLPKYRGAAPIQWAIIDGEKETGITIMQMDAGLDTGDMLMKTVVPIADTDTGESLHDKLATAGAKLCVKAIAAIERQEIVAVPQQSEEICYAKMLTKELGKIDFRKSAVSLERLIRGLNSWPSAYSKINGKNLKIWEAEVVDSSREFVTPGTIYKIEKDAIFVATGDGALKITSLQIEGKKRMSTESFLLGYPMHPGMVLGE